MKLPKEFNKKKKKKKCIKIELKIILGVVQFWFPLTPFIFGNHKN